jgi:ABC-2 type transport system permease protein
MSATAPAHATPRAAAALAALYGLLLRTQITLARLVGIALLGVLSLVLGLLARWHDQPLEAATDAVASYGLALVVPLAALWLGTSVLGDLVEDRLLVYVWLKPVPRWQLPAAAVLATTTVVISLTALPIAATGLVAGTPELIPASLLACVLAALAYSGLFVAAGLWFRRAVWWGLAFVLLWENLVGYISDGSPRFTVVGWAGAVLSTAPDADVSLSAGSATAAIVILPAICVAGWLVAVWRYRRADVD